MGDSQWQELLRELGMPEDEDVPSREEFRDWDVDAAANLILTEQTVANIWDVLAGRAKELGGHLCSISFPAKARRLRPPSG